MRGDQVPGPLPGRRRPASHRHERQGPPPSLQSPWAGFPQIGRKGCGCPRPPAPGHRGKFATISEDAPAPPGPNVKRPAGPSPLGGGAETWVGFLCSEVPLCWKETQTQTSAAPPARAKLCSPGWRVYPGGSRCAAKMVVFICRVCCPQHPSSQILPRAARWAFLSRSARGEAEASPGGHTGRGQWPRVVEVSLSLPLGDEAGRGLWALTGSQRLGAGACP